MPGGIAGGELGVFDDAGARDQVEQGGVGEPLGGELVGRDLAVDQRDGRAIGQAMVGRLAGLGRHFSGSLPMISTAVRNVAISIVADPRRVADLAAEVERRGDGRLAVVLGGHELDRGLGQHPVAGGRAAELRQRERAGDLLEEPHLALEQRGRAGHAVGGQQRGENGVARGERERAAFPHRELAGAGQPQGGAGRARRSPARARSARA